MGRRMTPAAVKEARGNPGRRPIEAQVPEVESDARAPAWLNAEARGIWGRLAPELTRMNLLKATDALTFGRYCQNFALWLKAAAALDNEDLVKETSSEHVVMDRLNKNLQAMLLLDRRLTDTEDRFGLNPSDRQRIFAQRAAGGNALPGELPLEPASETPTHGFLN